MCGICGIVHKEIAERIDFNLLKCMAESIRHRGPDEDGFFIQKNVGLANRRLSIIDIAGGRQPIFNEDKSISIIFNGEIYNHQLLRNKLITRGHTYYTKSDTESIVHAYEEYGTQCLHHLRGMFAFALYDNNKKILFLARDRFGKKPLYYYKDEKVFLFGSEIKCILKSNFIKTEANPETIDAFLSIGYVPGRETLFKNIYKLEPAQYLLLQEDFNIVIKKYWGIEDTQVRRISYQDACVILKQKLLESVKMRLMSEVPLGVFLSGGLDSSSIVALMSRVVSQPIKTFSLGYKDHPQANELAHARIIAQRFKTEHHEFYLEPLDFFESINLMLEHTEEPLADTAAIALYKLAKMAKPIATVLLSGEGADELLAGYEIYARMKIMEILYRIGGLIPAGLFTYSLNNKHMREKIIKYIDFVRMPFHKRYRSISFSLTNSIKEKMYTEDFKKGLSHYFESFFDELHKNVSQDTMLRRMLYIDIKTWLPDDILLKSDRMTMAASVELRAPFLDHQLAEFCFSLPDSYKIRGNRGKYILHEIMRDELPQEILHRKKMGFPVPVSSWLGKELKLKARRILMSKRALERNYFREEYINRLFERIDRGEDLGRRIFSLLVLELWHQKYID